jgi:hypothetical protein
MSQPFHEDGISFVCPDGWSLEREPTDDGWTVTLQSPGTAFAMLRLDKSLPAVQDVAAAALEALRADYPELDAANAIETIAGEMAVGHDVEFFSLDLSVTAWTRCFYGLAGTVLVLCQVSGADDDEYEPGLRALCASIRSEE